MRIKLTQDWKEYSAGDTIVSPDNVACYLIRAGKACQLDTSKEIEYPPKDKMIKGSKNKQTHSVLKMR
jgi:hypothetical protein